MELQREPLLRIIALGEHIAETTAAKGDFNISTKVLEILTKIFHYGDGGREEMQHIRGVYGVVISPQSCPSTKRKCPDPPCQDPEAVPMDPAPQPTSTE